MFYRKADREKLKQAREEGFNLGVEKTKATYEKKIQRLKARYASLVKEKIKENRELDKEVKKIQDKSKYLDEFGDVLYFAYHMATSDLFSRVSEVSKIFGEVEGVFNKLDIKRITKDRKDGKLDEAIEGYKEKRLKLAN